MSGTIRALSRRTRDTTAVMRSTAVCLAIALAMGCSDDAPPRTIAFDLDGELSAETYWDFPFPSDLRLTDDGYPDVAGFPNLRNLPVITDLLEVAAVRRGFPQMPIAWFRFTETPPAHTIDTLTDAAILVDIDDSSPERGQTFPVVAHTLADDPYATSVVAVAPRPGIVLRGHTRYAFVLLEAFAPGVSAPKAFTELAAGLVPSGARGAAAKALYEPLWPVLTQLGITRGNVLVATVFTTGDEVMLMRARSEAIRAAHDATITNVTKDPLSYPGMCSFSAQVTFPRFQVGTAPYSSGGGFMLDGNGTPIAQGMETVPLKITLPDTPMPTGGWPLWHYFHGSGGASFDLVDEGKTPAVGGTPTLGGGPGVVIAQRGIAAAASSLPIDNERLPSAGSYDYININNLSAFPYTFQQGVYEQRLLLDALVDLQLPGCNGGTEYFNAGKLVAGGHSMGGMYTNMIGAIEPRYGAFTPFGAGGVWHLMILDTETVPGARGLLGTVFGADADLLTFVHPAVALIELAWEIADPTVSMSRIAHRPLPGLTPRHVYQPVGLDDVYFPMPVFDAAALAYGNQQAGELVWPGTQEALAVDGKDGILPYPVTMNQATTAVVVQYRDDGIADSHQIYRQLDEVKYQYGCFLASYLRDGVPTVYAPAALSATCP